MKLTADEYKRIRRKLKQYSERRTSTDISSADLKAERKMKKQESTKTNSTPSQIKIKSFDSNNDTAIVPSQRTFEQKYTSDNVLSLAWKNKITDIDSQIKELEGTDINNLPSENRAAEVENIQTRLDNLRSTRKSYEKEYNNALLNGEQILNWYTRYGQTREVI